MSGLGAGQIIETSLQEECPLHLSPGQILVMQQVDHYPGDMHRRQLLGSELDLLLAEQLLESHDDLLANETQD